jgi:HSP20 family molecular chaperone IbpA
MSDICSGLLHSHLFVDIDALKARLRHGLLVMMIPKKRDGKHDSKRIEIED